MAEKVENMENNSVKPKDSIAPKDPAPENIPTESEQESQDLASETMALLKKKDEDIQKVRDLLAVSLKDWVHDLIRRVELVKSEVKSARNVVLPTCSVLDELAEKGEQNDEMRELVNAIMVNVECICKQIPVATSVIGLIMDQLRSLPQQTGEKKPGEIVTEKVEQADKGTKEVPASPGKTDKPRKKSDSSESPVSRSEVSSSEAKSEGGSVDLLPKCQKLQNPECLPGNKHLSGGETTSQAETEDTSGSKTPTESSDTPESLAKQRIRCLEAKIFEMECTSMIIGDVMRYWIRDMLEKIDYVRQDASLARKLVYTTNAMMQELPYKLPREGEVRVKMHDVIGKAEEMMKQVRSSTNLMSFVVDQVMHMKGMEDFREEICTVVLAEVPKNPDEIDPSSRGGADSVIADSVSTDANTEAAVSVTAAVKGKGKDKGKDKGRPPRQDLPERSPEKSPEKNTSDKKSPEKNMSDKKSPEKNTSDEKSPEKKNTSDEKSPEKKNTSDEKSPGKKNTSDTSDKKSPGKKNTSDKNTNTSLNSPKKKNKSSASRAPTPDKNTKPAADQNESEGDSASIGKEESIDSSSVDDHNESTDTIERLRGDTSSDYDTDLSCDSCGTYYFEDEAFEVSITNFAFLDLIEPVTLRNFRKISDCI